MSSFRLVKLVDSLNNVFVAGGLVPKGAYAAGTDYAVGDAVSYNGSSYVMYVDAGAGTAPTDTTKWMLLAAAGGAGSGVPVGGSAGQLLAKIDGTDYNTEWIANNSIAYAIALG